MGNDLLLGFLDRLRPKCLDHELIVVNVLASLFKQKNMAVSLLT